MKFTRLAAGLALAAAALPAAGALNSEDIRLLQQSTFESTRRRRMSGGRYGLAR